MKSIARRLLASVWSRPDPVLAQAGLAGELFVAKIRVGLSFFLFLIPAIDTIFFDFDRKETIVGLTLTTVSFLFSVIVYYVTRRDNCLSWLSFVSSAFDVSFISGGLVMFLLLNEPHTAVNSKVVFECYFLAIAGTSLRYDKRVCVTAGLLVMGEYLTIVLYAVRHWDLNSEIYAPFNYGVFGWPNQISRLIILGSASMLSFVFVSRSQKILQMATRDPLTGLLNRGVMDDRFAIELSRAQRYSQPLTVAVIDADHFKQLNDTYGHPAGDLVLKRVAAIIKDSFRQSDTAARYGGEEFVVVLPETDMETAQRKLEALRCRVENTAVVLPGSRQAVRITISTGLASYPEDGRDSDSLFALADDRMFQAKQEGRNRVVAGNPMEPAKVV